ncbi:hypothetical protein GJ744_003759 [Endocarpon pusillum]|uniref:MARVEL domain-containing protein n=1 Tax=Endocarpon pusillum TaxID=364733 RepID=A0A8H7A8N5_9EURO|nr:hypothetical protein GJ744_003759 [Endocarpon pusillum]
MSSPHVVALPRWFLVLRIFQILVAVAILGLAAHGIYWIPYNSWCLALFTSIATFIVVGYFLITSLAEACKVAYNYWAVLALEIFAVIFWLSSMANLAATRGAFVAIDYNTCLYDYYYCYKKRDTGLTERDIATSGYLDTMSAAAGLSGLEMLLFIATLVIFSVHMHRHRISGAPNAPSTSQMEANAMSTLPAVGSQQQQQQNSKHTQPSHQYEVSPA